MRVCEENLTIAHPTDSRNLQVVPEDREMASQEPSMAPTSRVLKSNIKGVSSSSMSGVVRPARIGVRRE